MIRGYEQVAITCELSMMNGVSTSQIISYIICSIHQTGIFEWCYVVIDITIYRSVIEQTWDNYFHMKWPTDDKWRVSECNQQWVTTICVIANPAFGVEEFPYKILYMNYMIVSPRKGLNGYCFIFLSLLQIFISI